MSTIPPFAFDRRFTFAVGRDTLWSHFERVDEFPRWWRWLRTFDADADHLRPGIEARCTIRGPVPYSLRLTIAVADLEPARHVATEVDGDLRGPARLELSDRPDGGSEARLVWRLEAIDPALRSMARVARPVLTWAHDVVVARGVHQFEQRALAPARPG